MAGLVGVGEGVASGVAHKGLERAAGMIDARDVAVVVVGERRGVPAGVGRGNPIAAIVVSVGGLVAKLIGFFDELKMLVVLVGLGVPESVGDGGNEEAGGGGIIRKARHVRSFGRDGDTAYRDLG